MDYIRSMGSKQFRVLIRKKTAKGLNRLPETVQKKLNLLLQDLRDRGPFLPHWPHYSKLGGDQYHCHLGISWVACWRHEKKTVIIEVYYVGSRENAPY
jgi:mRNA-degrading endonuclease RelE of RelBE toxin-antitoxin system